jgi:Transcriptional regulator, AbiEi antitoxin/Protein of unknown function (DUF559)
MPLPIEAMRWFAQHHGVAARSKLIELGVSAHQIDRRVLSGHLIVVHRGVYRTADWPAEGELTRCLAACLAAPGAAISHTTAARAWGLRRCTGHDVHLTVASARNPLLAGIVVHRTVTLHRADVVRRSDGIVLTSPVRTACDLAAVLDDGDLASVVERVLAEYRVQYRTVRRTADRLMRHGWNGAARLRSVLDGRPPGAAAQHSHLEVDMALALERSGLPAPVRQLPITILPGVDVHPDLAYPDAKLVIELDDRAWHSGDQAALDKRRDRLVKLAGFDTVRVTDDDLRYRFDDTVDEVVQMYRRASRRRPPLVL